MRSGGGNRESSTQRVSCNLFLGTEPIFNTTWLHVALLSELLFQFDCDWTFTFTTSYILQCAVILINNLVLIISNLISFIDSKANSSSSFQHWESDSDAHCTSLPGTLFPSKFSFQRLFALRLFQSFAVLWILCILSPSFLKWDCSWDHLPVLHLMLPLKMHRMVIVSLQLPIFKKNLGKEERGERRGGEGKERKEECRIWLTIIQNNGNSHQEQR